RSQRIHHCHCVSTTINEFATRNTNRSPSPAPFQDDDDADDRKSTCMPRISELNDAQWIKSRNALVLMVMISNNNNKAQEILMQTESAIWIVSLSPTTNSVLDHDGPISNNNKR